MRNFGRGMWRRIEIYDKNVVSLLGRQINIEQKYNDSLINALLRKMEQQKHESLNDQDLSDESKVVDTLVNTGEQEISENNLIDSEINKLTNEEPMTIKESFRIEEVLSQEQEPIDKEHFIDCQPLIKQGIDIQMTDELTNTNKIIENNSIADKIEKKKTYKRKNKKQK